MTPQLPPFDSARVLVAGDVMLDRYWQGPAARISPEAPVPVVRVEHTEARPGGAGNVALNIAALGGKATVFGVTGNDEAADLLVRHLEAAGVHCVLQREPGFATITKLRVLSRNQQLIRLDFENPTPSFDTASTVAEFTRRLPECGVALLSDYGKGALVQAPALIEAARRAGRPVLVDPKQREFAVYRGATVVTPNLAELEAVVGPCHGERELVEKGRALLRLHEFAALLITRGEHGMTLLRRDAEPLHLPAEAREVYDVTGAGDTVIAVLGAALAAGQDLPAATALANTAAGIVVGKLGTATVSVPELRRTLQSRQSAGRGVFREEQLLQMVADARAHGESIVMTNGCFDLLHAGHVAYLEQARRYGDRLIVAVNDDASVCRLKGPGRPVNKVERRMAVLAGLAAVDWVVPFSEDTPERLICRVLPDCLVKGGDYRPGEVAGQDCVREHGGRVEIVPLEPGCSTSALIAGIRAGS